MPPPDPQIHWKEVLDLNWHEGVYLGQSYGYTSPSPDWHRWQQWLWDSCFHIIMLAKYKPDRAKRELKTLLSTQYPDGLIPMINYWRKEPIYREPFDKLLWRRFYVKKKPGTIITQPPVICQALKAIVDATNDLDFLKEVIPQMKKYFRYLATERDPDSDGLISVIHPLESGTDMLSEFDEIFYGKRADLPFYRFIKNYFLNRAISSNYKKGIKQPLFDCRQAMFNAIYVINLYILSDLLGLISDDEASYFKELAHKAESSIHEKMWDEELGVYVSLYGNNRKTDILTISSLFPLILPNIPENNLNKLIAHLKDESEFNLPYGIPSVARSEPSFDPRSSIYLWQGTSWINANWYIFHGLKSHGHGDLAGGIASKSYEMVRMSGFREYYNPLTGEGYGDTEHGWSTLAVDMAEEAGIR